MLRKHFITEIFFEKKSGDVNASVYTTDPSQWDDAELSHLVVPEVEYPSDGEEEEGEEEEEEEEEDQRGGGGKRNRHVASCGS